MSEYLINESEIVQVADAIRAKSETTEQLSFPRGFIEAVSSIQSGGEDTLKKLLDATKSCYHLFIYCTLRSVDDLISYQSTSSVTNMTGMFYYCPRLITVPLLDTSSVTNMDSMFSGCSALNTIPLLDTSSVTSMKSMFSGCSALNTIPLLDVSSVTNTYNIFYYCKSLTECWIRNIQTNITVGSGAYGEFLTVESLVHLINELRNIGESRILTVGSVNLEKLANVYVKTVEITDEMRADDKYIDQKSPCVVCESTDEGATLIKNYALTKNWTIQ